MASDDKRKSEILFEELCESHGVPCCRLPELPDRQQPDYEITLAGRTIVVEVKQIDPNDEDRRFSEALDHNGEAFQRRNPDRVARRVRNHINKSRAQFNAYLNRYPDTPALLVLFDAARNQYTDPNMIRTAMHGWERVWLNVPPTGERMTVADRWWCAYPHFSTMDRRI